MTRIFKLSNYYQSLKDLLLGPIVYHLSRYRTGVITHQYPWVLLFLGEISAATIQERLVNETSKYRVKIEFLREIESGAKSQTSRKLKNFVIIFVMQSSLQKIKFIMQNNFKYFQWRTCLKLGEKKKLPRRVPRILMEMPSQYLSKSHKVLL